MKRHPAVFAVLAGLLAISRTSYAEDSIAISGNYYKELSTRIMEPLIRLTKDLPGEAELDVTYLVDQITSASNATTNTDEVIFEFRNEIRIGGRKKFAGFITPGLNARFSHEPDYLSWGVGGEVAVNLLDDSTTVSAFFQHLEDSVGHKFLEGFSESLSTTAIGLSVTRVVRKDLIAGIGGDAQILRGYQENQYRSEVHPCERDRFAANAWVRYRYAPSGTTGKAGYRFYRDTWKLTAHTIDLKVTQRILRGLEISPRFRYHTQSGTFFATPETTDDVTLDRCPDPDGTIDPNATGFSTQDPKLMAYNAPTYGFQISWMQHWLHDTPLEIFATSRIEPAYYYFDQKNRYGAAHIAQLDWFWPF